MQLVANGLYALSEQYLQLDMEIASKQVKELINPEPEPSQSKTEEQKIVVQKPFLCDICTISYEESFKNRLGHCQHYFCTQCLKNQVVYKISNYQEVTCPAQSCPEALDTDSDFFKGLDSLQQIRYQKIKSFLKVSKDRDLIICPNNECIEGILTLEKKNQLCCNKCKKSYCKECFLPVHKGKCIKNQPDFYRKNHGYRQCRNCKNVIQKNEGCIHMTCTCKNQFCYICGDVWSPDHPRDCNLPDYQDLNVFGKISRTFSRRKISNFFSRNFSFSKLRNIGGHGKFGIFLRIFIKLLIFLPIYILYLAISIMLGILAIAIALIVNILIIGPKTACQGFGSLTRREKITFMLISPVKIFLGIKERVIHMFSVLPDISKSFRNKLSENGAKMLEW